jgi:hypothetical protein
MGWLGDLVTKVGNGALESAAMHQAGIGVPEKKGGRKMKKAGDEGGGCTPCAAMANVDSHRTRLGYSIK